SSAGPATTAARPARLGCLGSPRAMPGWCTCAPPPPGPQWPGPGPRWVRPAAGSRSAGCRRARTWPARRAAPEGRPGEPALPGRGGGGGRAGPRAAGGAAAVVLLVVAAAPVSLVAALAVTLAWLGGWPPRRLYRAALACLPMVAVWLVAAAIAGRSVPHAAAVPYQAWLASWHQLAAGPAAPAATTIAPPAIPLRPARARPARARRASAAGARDRRAV